MLGNAGAIRIWEEMQMRKIVTTTIISLAMASTSTMALAQASEDEISDQGGLEEILVVATKRSENMQDVPVAVSAISARDLANQGVFETSDLSNSMPNLQVSSPYGEQQPNFSVRGVGVGTEFNANAASPIGVYVDEVYQAFRASHGQQLYDLEQIEVVRGPQGTLYGRNTTGGAINFITRKPSLSGTNGSVTAGYGNFNRINFAGAIEFTPAEDKVGIRLAGTFVDSDPYVKNRLAAGVNRFAANGASGLNLNTGRDPGGTKAYGLRLSVRAKPSEAIDITLKGYLAKSTGGTEGPLPTGQSTTNDVINFQSPNFLLGGLFAALGPGGAGLLPASYSQSGRGLGRNEIEADTVGKATTRSEGAVLSIRAELSDALSLVSTSGYDSGLYEQANTDCDATPFRGCAIGYRSEFNAFNQDLRFDYSSERFKMIVGAFYGKDNITGDNSPDFFNSLRDVNAALGGLGVYNAIPGGYRSYFNPGGGFNGTALSAASLPTGITAQQHFKQVRTSWAIYGEGSFELTDTLKFTAGLRYTDDKNVFKDGITTYFDDAGVARMLTVSNYAPGGVSQPYFLQPVYNEAGAVVIPSFQALGIPLPGGLRRDGSSKKVTGRAIIDWKPVDDVMLYASYSRGYRAGTFNGLAYGSANQVYFVRPEQVNAYEVGFKSRFADNRVQINGSFFYYDYKGQQGQVVDATATANLTTLDGTLKGLEIDAQFAVTDTLRLSASFGLLDSKYADGDCPANPALIPSFPAQLGSCVVSSGGPVSVAGNPFPYAAKTSANLAFDWEAAEIGSGTLSLHGDASYTGQFYYDSFKDYSRGPLPTVATGKFAQGEGKYWVLNSRLSYDTDSYSIAIWGKNLTNKTYFPYGISLENLFGSGYRVRAQPRTYGIEATLKF
jgi:iron complex outermembrane recepter protein